MFLLTIDNTKNAIEFIRKNYVNTSIQKHNFEINTQYILAYIAMMNLSRKAAKYFNIFKINKKGKTDYYCFNFLISPKLAINLKEVYVMKFSVLMSLYFKEKPQYLIECFESLSNQTIHANEIILVFDGPITK